MQNPTLDAVQLSSMLEDFAKFGQLRKERRRKTKQANEEPNKNKETDRSTVEVKDSFERETGGAVEEENIKEGKPNVQYLLKVIKTAGLE